MVTTEKEARAVLEAAGVENAAFDAHILFEEGGDLDALVKARAAGEPLQYLVREWEFFGLPMKMRPGVLIARADTEVLVEQALKMACEREVRSFLELGCGSGAVSIALKKYLPAARAEALDLNPAACALTRENAARNGVDLCVIEGDLFEMPLQGPFDLILSNPPYLTEQEMGELSREVQREPASALFGGADGLDFYRFILPQYFPLLAPGGALLFEVGDAQAAAVAALMEKQGAAAIETTKDYAGIPRVVACRKGTL